MASEEEFQAAVAGVKGLSKAPSNNVLLDLYGLFKQASTGDVSGKRPGALNLKGRAKYDAWSKRKGMGADDARGAYVSLVNGLTG